MMLDGTTGKRGADEHGTPARLGALRAGRTARSDGVE